MQERGYVLVVQLGGMACNKFCLLYTSGTVVYADWLRGFGNLIIVDHGQQYLTVYAYNQSLLKRVGDSVAAGDTIATVGVTGGQVESGLYFEIRHRGAPVDPAQWLAQ